MIIALRPNTRHAVTKLLRQLLVALCSQQPDFFLRPRASVLRALRDSQGVSFQLNRKFGPPQHPRHDGIGAFAKQLDFARGSGGSSRGENRDTERFALCRDCAWTAAQKQGKIFVPYPAEQLRFAIQPSFPVRDARAWAVIKIQESVRLT